MKACVRRHFQTIMTGNDSDSLLSRPSYTKIATEIIVSDGRTVLRGGFFYNV